MWKKLLTLVPLVLVVSCGRVGGPIADDAGGDADGGWEADAENDAREDVRLDADRDIVPRLEDVLVYAHSRDTLYSFSPATNTVDEIGVFTLPSGEEAPYMLDLAVNELGEIFTCSDTALYTVDPETAVATEVGDFQLGEETLYALTFLPRGVYANDRETLIGATNQGVYYVIDPTNAQPGQLGVYPDGWQSSGDIVSVAGLGTFATVKREDSPESADVLVEMHFNADGSTEVDVLGHVAQGERAYRQIFGVGYWGRALYGFTNAGELVEIDRTTGSGTLVSETTGAEQFWGAGVTTLVPVLY